jgi:hypothetical protein
MMQPIRIDVAPGDVSRKGVGPHDGGGGMDLGASFRRAGKVLALLGCIALSIVGCGRAGSSKAAASGTTSADAPRSSSGEIDTASLLTKEEVSAVIGVPVTSLEASSKSHVTYKTADPMLEAGLEVERKDGTADAVLAMAGARKATNFLGGTPQPAPGLGDDSFYGAMSTLYVRAGDVVLTISPPNLQQVAQGQAYNKMIAAGTDADANKKAMDELAASMKGDPKVAGNAERDPMKAAVDVIHASSAPQGTEYEAKARMMAAALARKALARL